MVCHETVCWLGKHCGLRMSKAPRLTGRQIIAILEKQFGFKTTRTKGSHNFLKHADGRATVVPVHSGEIIGPGLFCKILRDVELEPDDFRQ
ncbi:MAG: type II toxin-antitoxin system HicA family toxin [Verrucomicrobiia bacterium]